MDHLLARFSSRERTKFSNASAKTAKKEMEMEMEMETGVAPMEISPTDVVAAPSEESTAGGVAEDARPERKAADQEEEPDEETEATRLWKLERAEKVKAKNQQRAERAEAKQDRKDTSTATEVWLEKHRPRTLDEAVGNNELLEPVRMIEKQGHMDTHILACGPPGCGKTTAMMALVHSLLGEDEEKALLMLNASEDRGIDAVRKVIEPFAKKTVTTAKRTHKIIFLDEADAMTPVAQGALRKVMEQNSKTTRFILTCNFPEQIIEALHSRCAVMRFKVLTKDDILARILRILDLEGVSYDVRGLQALVYSAEGDMRIAINNAQATMSAFGKITAEGVLSVCDQPHPALVQESLKACLEGDWEAAHGHVQELFEHGYNNDDIVSTYAKMIGYLQIDEDVKREWIEEVAKVHVGMGVGKATRLRFDMMICNLITIVNNVEAVRAKRQQIFVATDHW